MYLRCMYSCNKIGLSDQGDFKGKEEGWWLERGAIYIYMYLSTCISISQENCLAISKSQGTPLYGLHQYVQPQPSLRRTAWPSPSHGVLPYMGYIGMCNPNHLSGELPGHLQVMGYSLIWATWVCATPKGMVFSCVDHK